MPRRGIWGTLAARVNIVLVRPAAAAPERRVLFMGKLVLHALDLAETDIAARFWEPTTGMPAAALASAVTVASLRPVHKAVVVAAAQWRAWMDWAAVAPVARPAVRAL